MAETYCDRHNERKEYRVGKNQARYLCSSCERDRATARRRARGAPPRMLHPTSEERRERRRMTAAWQRVHDQYLALFNRATEEGRRALNQHLRGLT